MRPKPLIAGNWKMNGLKAAVGEVRSIAEGLAEARGQALLCLPATLIMGAARLVEGTPLAIGAQDCHVASAGAHTGDLSAEMLKDAGASHVILGHSERRRNHDETNAVVAAKVAAARRAGLVPIVCVGESEDDRLAGRALVVTSDQLERSLPAGIESEALVVAYEPVWAIGSGRTPTTAEILGVHGALRAALVARFGEAGGRVPILYGGSVKPDNAAEILAIDHVDGALVGGASLKARDFLAIVAALPCPSTAPATAD